MTTAATSRCASSPTSASKLTALTAPELREWPVELHETGTWAPETLTNALEAHRRLPQTTRAPTA